MAVYLLFRTFKHLRVEKIPVRQIWLSSRPHVRSVYGEKIFSCTQEKHEKVFVDFLSFSNIAIYKWLRTRAYADGSRLGKGECKNLSRLI